MFRRPELRHVTKVARPTFRSWSVRRVDRLELFNLATHAVVGVAERTFDPLKLSAVYLGCRMPQVDLVHVATLSHGAIRMRKLSGHGWQ